MLVISEGKACPPDVLHHPSNYYYEYHDSTHYNTTYIIEYREGGGIGNAVLGYRHMLDTVTRANILVKM